MIIPLPGVRTPGWSVPPLRGGFARGYRGRYRHRYRYSPRA